MMTFQEVLNFKLLSEDLGRVDRALLDSLQCDGRLMSDLTSHLARVGGNRLRPALVLLCSYVDSDHPPGVTQDAPVRGAVAIELLHLGSLYHDDAFDESVLRRSVESANARWGNSLAVLAGDVLISRSFNLGSQLGLEYGRLVASTLDALCQGQAIETLGLFDPGRSVESYLEAIRDKTAALMSAACRMGAMTAVLGPAEVNALTSYGLHLGMVYQILDDVLDLVATEDDVGKPTGSDLVEGVYTLPLLYAIEEDTTIVELLADAAAVRRDARPIIECILATEGLGRALELAEVHQQAAMDELSRASALAPAVAERLSELPAALLRPVQHLLSRRIASQRA